MLYEAPTGSTDPNASYQDGNPNLGIQGSVVPAAAIEAPMREIVSVINASGQTPSIDTTQLLRGIRSGALDYYFDQGVVNAPAVLPSPAHTALIDGLRIRVKMLFAPTGPTNLTVNGTLVAPVKRRGNIALQGGEWSVGDIVTLNYSLAQNAFQLDGLTVSDVTAVVQNRLTANTTFYVNAAIGSDTLYDGTSATVSGTHGPFATPQHAANVFAGYFLNGFVATISVAAGTYGQVNAPQICGGTLAFVATGGTVIISTNLGSAMTFGSVGSYSVGTNFQFSATASAAIANVGVFAGGSGVNVTLNSPAFGYCYGGFVLSTNGAQVTLNGTLTFSGSTSNGSQTAFFIAQFGGTISGGAVSPLTVVLTTAISAAYFIYATACGLTQILIGTITGSSNATCSKYLIVNNSVCSLNGGGINYYPGNAAGSTVNGGVYS